MARGKVLSIAVASGNAGFVFLNDRVLVDWGCVQKATSSAVEMAGFAQTLITELEPEVVVTENCQDPGCRKGAFARELVRAVAETASHNYLHDVAVTRPRAFGTKHAEAEDIVIRYPELAGQLPGRPRKFFETEARSMMIFEAMALAEAA